mgnify:CR=1 FL=1
MCPIPIILLVASLFQKKLSPKYLDVRNAAGNLSSSIFNNLLGIITIKGFTAEQYETNKILQMSNEYQNKNQSAISNIFKRVPNYNYEKESTEAIVPGIGGMGASAAEDSFMGEGENSPLQQQEKGYNKGEKYN